MEIIFHIHNLQYPTLFIPLYDQFQMNKITLKLAYIFDKFIDNNLI